MGQNKWYRFNRALIYGFASICLVILGVTFYEIGYNFGKKSIDFGDKVIVSHHPNVEVPEIIDEVTKNGIKYVYVYIKVPTYGKVIADYDGYLATGFIGLDTVRFTEGGQFELADNSLLVITCSNNKAVVPRLGYSSETALVTCGDVSDIIKEAKSVLDRFEQD